MALATKCPHCNTIFRVAADQLKLRGGIVRCGTCREVFDGNAALVDPAAASPFASGPATVTPLSPPYPLDASLPSATDDEPIYSLDFDTSFDPFGILPETAQLRDDEDEDEHIELDLDVGLPAEVPGDAPVAAPAPLDPSAATPVATPAALPEAPLPQPMAPFKRRQADDAPAFATYLRDSRREPSLQAGPRQPCRQPKKSAWTSPCPAPVADGPARQEPTFGDSPFAPLPAATVVPDPPGDWRRRCAAPDADPEPAFVTQGRRREQSGKAVRVAMAVGSVALLLLLLLQVTTFRNPWRRNFRSGSRPGGIVQDERLPGGLPAQIDALSIEQGELQTLKEQTFSLCRCCATRAAACKPGPASNWCWTTRMTSPCCAACSPARLPACHVDVSQGLRRTRNKPSNCTSN
jgi:predicted Zn finger-like uncharacterized protein